MTKITMAVSSCITFLAALCFLLRFHLANGFSSPSADNKNADASFTLFDRFRAVCPADLSSVEQFDSSLAAKSSSNDEDDASIWVAVYRYNNNKPSVLVRDEFLRAMRSATDPLNILAHSSTQSSPSLLFESIGAMPSKSGGGDGVHPLAPVAVARLTPSILHDSTWVLDCMRCALRKEDTNSACDGGSEHNEAIAVAIDVLLEKYLSFCDRFDGVIRTKATIYSASLLEERGFLPVSKLEADMATHISSLDACIERYAERSISDISKSPGARQRASNIVSLLGQLNREKVARENKAEHDEGPDEYDPWAGSMIR